MKALLFRSKDEELKINEVAKPVPGPGEVLIELKYAALNHLDIWIRKEQVLEEPVILGSDGSGIVHAVGDKVENRLTGKEVVINPALFWGNNDRVQSADFQILGNPTNGTFAEYITIPREYVFEKPKHLSLKEAAALPLAALTAFRALFTKAQLKSTDKVLITGIGGGAALFLLQMAGAVKASVYVTSSSSEKIRKAISLGAVAGFNYKEKDWVLKAKKEAGGFDVIIDSAGGDGFGALAEVANPAARIVVFGRTAGNINNLKPGLIFNKQLQIMGTLMGNPTEFASMLDFYEQHQLHPVLDKEFDLDQASRAFEYMAAGSHFGKIIINIQQAGSQTHS